MAKVTISNTSWTNILTTTADTAIQACNGNVLIYTGTPGAALQDDGVMLREGHSCTVASGFDVYGWAEPVGNSGDVSVRYMSGVTKII